jgi:uncharacterized protein YydD (DUF2326 family)
MSAFRQQVVPFAPLRLPVRGREPIPATSPGFLIHDSTIFDGVDERQRAEALELAASESQAHGLLDICTLNSDYIPRNEFSSDFRIEDYIRLRLTDADVAGRLMGVRF